MAYPIPSYHSEGPVRGSRDSGFKFQTDRRFKIQISKRQDSGFKIHFSNMQGFRIQIWNWWDSRFRFGLTGPYSGMMTANKVYDEAFINPLGHFPFTASSISLLQWRIAEPINLSNSDSMRWWLHNISFLFSFVWERDLLTRVPVHDSVTPFTAFITSYLERQSEIKDFSVETSL